MLIRNIQDSLIYCYTSKAQKPEKICLTFEKMGKTPKSKKNTPSDLAYQITLLLEFQAPICKNVEFCIFCLKKDHGCVFIVIIFPPRGNRIESIVLEYRERAHLNKS
jgi:hypothetical protein